MPFTPFHLGPALALGLPLRKYIHAPTFILASVAVDVEPFLVLYFKLSYPLHGYLHTVLFSSILGIALSCAMFIMEKSLNPLYAALLLEEGDEKNLRSFVLAGVSGATLHVLLDSPLYRDIRPFYPFLTNPILNPALSMEIQGICTWMGILGMIYYAILFALAARNRISGQSKQRYSHRIILS